MAVHFQACLENYKKTRGKWKYLLNSSFCDIRFYFFLVIQENNNRREFKFSPNIDRYLSFKVINIFKT